MTVVLRVRARRGTAAVLGVVTTLVAGAAVAVGVTGGGQVSAAPATQNAGLVVQAGHAGHAAGQQAQEAADHAGHDATLGAAQAAAALLDVKGAVAVVAASPTLRIEHDPGDGYGYYDGDLGFYLVAGKKPLLVTVHRKVYGKPATATLTLGTKTVALPRGAADLQGLRDFLQVDIVDAKGHSLGGQNSDYCGDGYGYYGSTGGGRARPDAPDTSPYTAACPYHPFAQGAVVGLQAGWLASLSSVSTGGLDDGTYTVTARLSERWRTLLGVPKAQASAKVAVTVATRPGPTPSTSTTEPPTGPPSPTPTPSGPTKVCGDYGSVQGVAAARQAEAKHARLLASVSSVAKLVAGANASAAAGPLAAASLAKAPRPDLVALPSFGIQLALGKDLGDGMGGPADPAVANHCFLTFGATVWNAGTSPLVVEGFRAPGAKVMDAYQYFYAGSKQVGYGKVGTMAYDPRKGHEHWHFKDFAQYNLLDAKQKLKVRSAKEAFCLAPTDPIDLTRPGANWNPGSTGLYSACGGLSALSIKENLDAGWGDTYGQSLPGQSFDVDALPNGTYYVEVVANPDHRLQETTTANNRSIRKIILGGTVDHRTVTVPPYDGIKAP